jgi:4-hydroxyphenylpyruvate dioxygenase
MLQIDHVHFYVEDAKKWRDWFVKYLGFQALTSRIFPSFVRQVSFPDTHTEVIQNGNVTFLLSSPLLSSSPVAEFLSQHPPGVADIAFAVEDIASVLTRSQNHGVRIVQSMEENEFGQYAKIAAWGSLTHTLISRNTHQPVEVLVSDASGGHSQRPDLQLTVIDHLVLNLAVRDLAPAIGWYEKIFHLQPQQTFKIATDYSALCSQVMVSVDGHVQLALNAPASPNSQIQEFLDINQGAGIQHIALRTNNLIQLIAEARKTGTNAAGLSFLPIPETYYLSLPSEIQSLLSPTELTAIAQQEILVDWRADAPTEAVLLQIFSQPIFAQPTFFLEFIERRCQASGFGEGNFRALFMAVEAEQIKRQNTTEMVIG